MKEKRSKPRIVKFDSRTKVVGDDELSFEDRRKCALEALKFLTAYGFHPDVAEQAIRDLAQELTELSISREEILATIQEVKQSDDNFLCSMFSRIDANPFCPDCPEGRIVHIEFADKPKRRRHKSTPKAV